ncbi:hypothetical protein [Paractinoplanes lichenicola]|uniref:Uncharacterized protein n=1 Tax=Paractinoplanes lichenicola TaxID=2802976 RepID=A0ABS1VL92_9ACTN|nr:hypothetical protein [Actinoplanes lichenicola]MBL7255358.1 hypothetical protein [Actinoplanes lichenicola]
MSQMTSRRTGSVTGARVCTIIAFVFAALAVLFLPPVMGLVAIVLGLVGGYLGDRPLGWYAAAAGAVGAVLGMVLGAILLNAS